MSLYGGSSADGSQLSREGRRYLSFMRWLPLLWLLGVHIIIPVSWTVVAALKSGLGGGLARAVAISWIVVGCAQASSVVLNWSARNDSPLVLLNHLISVPVLGWVVLGLAIGVGAQVGAARPEFVRVLSRLALQILAVGSVAIAVYVVLRYSSLMLTTPAKMVGGDSLAARFYLNANVYQTEYSFGFMFPRLMVFQPWPTALGLAGIFCFTISLVERERWWRLVGVAGGVFAVAMSASRAAYVLLPVALGVYVLARYRASTAAAMLLGFAALVVLAVLVEPEFINWAESAVRYVTGGRAGSSMARDLIYRESWDAFTASPWIGYGWIGQSVIRQEMLPIGSHSSVFGVLYTGGLITFVPLLVATTLTFYGVIAARARGGREAAAGAAIFAAAVAFAYGESMYSLVPGCIPGFLFLGGAISSAAPQANTRLRERVPKELVPNRRPMPYVWK